MTNTQKEKSEKLQFSYVVPTQKEPRTEGDILYNITVHKNKNIIALNVTLYQNKVFVICGFTWIFKPAYYTINNIIMN